jgi:hypothetical protein
MTHTTWSPVTEQSKPYFTEEDTKEIYKRIQLGKRIPAIHDESQLAKIAERLDYAASWYFEFKNRASGPKTADIKKSLERVQKTASAFYQCLSDLDHWTKHEHLLLSVELIEETKQAAGLINYRAKKVLEEFKTIAHRPRSLAARENFIHMLAVVYEETTDRKAAVSRDRETQIPGGPFFRFVKNGLEHIDAVNISDGTLYDSIRDSLKTLNKHKKALANTT